MKTGLVMEGGSMRGMFTAGVTDVFLENGVSFNGAVGVSAGCAFGCNFKSNQAGRAIRYNKQYCRDKRYVSLRSLFRTGNIYNVDFAYHELPEKLDLFDTVAFRSSPMEFFAVATDCKTGKAVYHKCMNGDSADIEWFRASAALPLAFKPVKIGGLILSDGGTADSIPIKFMESQGYDRNVVILTQPDGFVKQKNKMLPFMKLSLKKYPKLIEALENRHYNYNLTLKYIKEQENEGKIIVIRPPCRLDVGAVEKDPGRLEIVYQLGRAVGERRLDEVKKFLKKE